MADTTTPNYSLVKADPSSPMSNFSTYLNANWDIVAGAVAPDSGATLPQSGSYKIGDRFYKSDTQSIYILITQDANWGWYWRPVHDGISPWFTVPSTCLALSNWTLNPVTSNPFAIALDNRGMCYWRGVIGTSTGNITRNSSYSLFKPLPVGLRPRQRSAFMLGHEPLSVGTDGTLLTSWQGARAFIFDTATDFASIRTFGGTADFNRVYLNGVQYAVGTAKYTTP